MDNYYNSSKGNKSFTRNNVNRNNYGTNSVQETLEPLINESLKEHYKDVSKIYLENGDAYRWAKKFKENSVSSSQLRKILDVCKRCQMEDNFDSARNRMFSMVMMTAYNAGRESKLTVLYSFIRSNINEKSITDFEDIKIFDKVYTSIIAYHRYLGGKQ